MSSGTLPFEQYHRTKQLGNGSFGSVVVVYNNDGNEYAMKLFMNDENENEDSNNNHKNKNDTNDSNDSEYIEEQEQQSMNIGMLREISCLRLLRDKNSHLNIIEMIDIQPPTITNTNTNTSNDDDEEENDEDEEEEQDDNEEDNDDIEENIDCNGGAGTCNYIGMTIPLGKYTLSDAIQQQLLYNTNIYINQKYKIQIAYGILNGIHYLHTTCGIIHRDIKCDNILLNYNYITDEWIPIIIDFSLAKPINNIMWKNNYYMNNTNNIDDDEYNQMTFLMEQIHHTGEIGTLVYTAPEVMYPSSTITDEYDNEISIYQYTTAVDIYSIGVVLLELISNSMFTGHNHKYKDIYQQIQTSIKNVLIPKLHLPFPQLIYNLLLNDPKQRINIYDALHHTVFYKFNIIQQSETCSTTGTSTTTIRTLDISTALPYSYDTFNDDHDKDITTDNNDHDHDYENNENTIPNDNIQNNHTSTSIDETTKLSIPKQIIKIVNLQDKYSYRITMIDLILKELNSCHPMTKYAALEYSIQYEQLDDTIDDVPEEIDTISSILTSKQQKASLSYKKKNKIQSMIPSQIILDCCLLAYQFHEINIIQLPNDILQYKYYNNSTISLWDYNIYIENEMTIFMLCDYCLYPRYLSYIRYY